MLNNYLFIFFLKFLIHGKLNFVTIYPLPFFPSYNKGFLFCLQLSKSYRGRSCCLCSLGAWTNFLLCAYRAHAVCFADLFAARLILASRHCRIRYPDGMQAIQTNSYLSIVYIRRFLRAQHQILRGNYFAALTAQSPTIDRKWLGFFVYHCSSGYRIFQSFRSLVMMSMTSLEYGSCIAEASAFCTASSISVIS